MVYPVARGGMARVWVAKLRGKHGFEKMVALKTILPTFAQDQRFRRMFLDEAKIASGIEHVNVAQILDLGEQAGQLYLVMEWVDGDSLQELDRAAEKAGSSLPIPVLVRVLADACAGLHAAHELADAHGRTLNVVHRDVSPQNILIGAKGVVKLIDFGVVKARRRTTEETTTGTIKGKLQYMAPEQALGQGVDRRADIWAVGATLYRLLARRPVYRGNSPLSTFKRLTSTMAPEPLPSHVPGALSTIVLKALAFEPERRFSSAAELGAALEALLQGPYQTTSREVAACVEQYLGPALAARRSAITEALEEQAPGERTQPTAPEWESGVSTAKTLPHSAPPSAPPTVVERAPASSPVDEVTRPLQQAPLLSRPPEPSGPPSISNPSKLVAAGGVLVLGATLVWSLGASPPSVAAPPAASAAPRPVAPAPTPSPVVEAPLSVQALPILSETPPPATPPKPAAATDAPATGKKKVVPSRPAVVSKPKRKVVDDGF
ncbi:MAG TPA: serine/threonine-protein kinase [Polyangiaceae bacterium]|nr:serine/threonine-protein kinase [Polyangiaceae bacterium]